MLFFSQLFVSQFWSLISSECQLFHLSFSFPLFLMLFICTGVDGSKDGILTCIANSVHIVSLSLSLSPLFRRYLRIKKSARQGRAVSESHFSIVIIAAL